MDLVQKRFDELAATKDKIAGSQTTKQVQKRSKFQMMGEPVKTYPVNEPTLDTTLLIEWQTSVLSLLSRVFWR